MIDWRALRERFGLGHPLDAGTQLRLDAILWQLGETHALLEARLPKPADEAPVSMAPTGVVRDEDGTDQPSSLDSDPPCPLPSDAPTPEPAVAQPARPRHRKAA